MCRRQVCLTVSNSAEGLFEIHKQVRSPSSRTSVIFSWNVHISKHQEMSADISVWCVCADGSLNGKKKTVSHISGSESHLSSSSLEEGHATNTHMQNTHCERLQRLKRLKSATCFHKKPIQAPLSNVNVSQIRLCAMNTHLRKRREDL